jgi:hypothetical protein
MKITKDTFLEDVKDHKMEVVCDNQSVRLLKFRSPSTNCLWFEIVTWPGSLCITGDCGSFVFRRLPDMFEFFRGDNINPSYWAEKLEADDKTDGYETYSPEIFRARIIERTNDFLDYYGYDEGSTEIQRAILLEQLEESVLADVGDKNIDLQRAIEFQYGDVNPFQDFWEVDCIDYTPRFIWCCYAIQWAISQYDQYKPADKQ